MGLSTNERSHAPAVGSRVFSASKPPSLNLLKKLITESQPIHYPLASNFVSDIPVYELPEYTSLSSEQHSALQDEWYHTLLSGPGVFAVKYMYKDTDLLDKVSGAYSDIIAQEKQHAGKCGDHFAGSCANDRIWSSFSKHCLQDPASSIEYYSNPWLPLISSAWLGLHHRLTAQVNIVKPGAKAQISHRDYHIGFQDAVSCAQFPKAAHVAYLFLILQGVVAHSDMPLESGPTRLLPFSQKFEEGYMAYRIPEFQDYFIRTSVSVPLEKGDGLFFNSVFFHVVGQNDLVDIMRSANLLQISSAFGTPMETIDTHELIERTWDILLARYRQEDLSAEVATIIGNVAEG